MTKSEKTVTEDFLKNIPDNVILYRNNIGTFRTIDGRWIKTGLCNGSSDFIGYTKTRITADMIGQDIAIFTAVEIKTSEGRLSKQQKEFLERVEKNGGIAKIYKGN